MTLLSGGQIERRPRDQCEALTWVIRWDVTLA